MMKISGRVTWCCVALLLALTSVSAVKTLNSISDLKKINFVQSVPKHSLLLLHWFANTVNIEDNNVMSLTFDPTNGDYGSHHYGNFEEMLDPLPRGSQYQYYTIGNLHQETRTPLPSYVTRPRREYAGENEDRIIVRVREQNTGWNTFWRVDQVYITQHMPEHSQYQGEYDPDHTYRITTNLLRMIGDFSLGQNQQQLSYLRRRFRSNADDVQIRNTWGDLACLGLLLYIVIQEGYSTTYFTPQTNHTPEFRQQSAYRPENRETDWCAALMKCCMILAVLLIGLFILAFSAASR